ncbi:MAG TPA: hypothetical protein DEF72_05020 [Gammaproteobacteria bacterium]|nr:hypothetical protein [Gammaproteobacteria bacterium]
MLKPKDSQLTSDSIYRFSDWSDSRRRRYRLSRFWGSGPIACVIGLNPSRADDKHDDPTNRRLISLLTCLGFDGYWLVNLIPEFTPYPNDLGSAPRRLSAINGQLIQNSVSDADQTILAWGHGGWRCPFRKQVTASIQNPTCFGLTKDGEPRHPLYIPKNSTLQLFPGYE